MMNFKVKLLSSYNMEFWGVYSQLFLPYGLGILTAFLRDNGVDVVMDDLMARIEAHNISHRLLHNKINLNVLENDERIMRYINGRIADKDIVRLAEQLTRIASCEGYGLIGLSVMSYPQFLFALILAKSLKFKLNTKIVLGGPFITIHGKEFFAELPFIDYLIIGDGQIPLLALIEYLMANKSIEDVPSLLYRKNDDIKSNPMKLFPIEDLYPPDFSDLSLDYYNDRISGRGIMMPYQISRGCSYRCSFCQHSLIYPHVEIKSHAKVISELKTMKSRYKAKFFYFCDSAINLSYRHLNSICDLLSNHGLDILWAASARPDNLDRAILRKMKKAGCVQLSFGIESGSNRILKNMRKGFTIEQASRVMQDCYHEGIENFVNIIVGYPHENEKDIKDTSEFIRRNAKYIDRITDSIPLQLGYGSLLWSYPESFGIKNLRWSYDIFHKMGLKYFAFDEINGLKWEDKIKQTVRHRRIVFRAIFKYVTQKKGLLKIIPFWFYFWLRENWRSLRVHCSFLQNSERFLFLLLRK